MGGILEDLHKILVMSLTILKYLIRILEDPQGSWESNERSLRTFDKILGGSLIASLQAVTGGFIAENPFCSVIERHLGFLRRALPGTSGRAQKSRQGEGEGREKPPARKPAPLE